MNFLIDKRKRKIFIVISSVVLTLAIILGACAIYLGDYYHADEGAIAVFGEDENITVSASDNGNVRTLVSGGRGRYGCRRCDSFPKRE